MYVPQYENLSIERILETAKKNPRISDYLPDDRDMHKVPRQWLINVAYTVLGTPFKAWVENEIASRNEELAKKQKLLIEMDPEIAKAFHSSVNISSKFIVFAFNSTVYVLTPSLLFSIKWKQCSPPQSWFEAPSNSC